MSVKVKTIDKILTTSTTFAYLRGAENTLNMIKEHVRRGRPIDQAIRCVSFAIEERRQKLKAA